MRDEELHRLPEIAQFFHRGLQTEITPPVPNHPTTDKTSKQPPDTRLGDPLRQKA
jgi:hypothetical protein